MDKQYVRSNNPGLDHAFSRAQAGVREGLLTAILDSMPELIAAVDTDCCFTAFNAAYAREFRTIFGVELKVGSDLAAMLAPLPEDQRAALGSV